MKFKSRLLLSSSLGLLIGSSFITSYVYLNNGNIQNHQDVDLDIEQQLASTRNQIDGFMEGHGLESKDGGLVQVKNKKNPNLNIVSYDNDFAGKALSIENHVATILKENGTNNKSIALINGLTSEVVWTRAINNNETINSIKYLEAKQSIYVLTHKNDENKICLYRLNSRDGSIIPIEGQDSKTIDVLENTKEKYFLVNAGGTNDTLLLNTRALMTPNNRKLYSWEIIDNQTKNMEMRVLKYTTTSGSKLNKENYLFSLSSVIANNKTYYIEMSCWVDEDYPEIWISTEEEHVLAWYHSPTHFVGAPTDTWLRLETGVAVEVKEEANSLKFYISIPFEYENGKYNLLYAMYDTSTNKFSRNGVVNLQSGPDYDFNYIYLEYDQANKTYGDYYGQMNWTSPQGDSQNLGKSGFKLRTNDWDNGNPLDSVESYRFRNDTNTQDSRLFIYTGIKDMLTLDSLVLPLKNKNMIFFRKEKSDFLELNTLRNINGILAYNTILVSDNLFIPNQTNVLANKFDNNNARKVITNKMIFDVFSIHGNSASTSVNVQSPTSVSEVDLYQGKTKADITITNWWNEGTLQTSELTRLVVLNGFHQWTTESTKKSYEIKNELAKKSIDDVNNIDITNFAYANRTEILKDVPISLTRSDFSVNSVVKDKSNGSIKFNLKLSSYVDREHRLQNTPKEFQVTLIGFPTELAWWVYVAIAVGVILLIIAIVVIILLIKKKKERDEEEKRKRVVINRQTRALPGSRASVPQTHHSTPPPPPSTHPRPQGPARPPVGPPRKPIR